MMKIEWARVGFMLLALAIATTPLLTAKAAVPVGVRDTIREHVPQFRECYVDAATGIDNLSGKMILRWRVRRNGAVRRAAVLSDTTGSALLAQCVADIIIGIDFSETGFHGTLTWPFTFRPVDCRAPSWPPRMYADSPHVAYHTPSPDVEVSVEDRANNEATLADVALFLGVEVPSVNYYYYPTIELKVTETGSASRGETCGDKVQTIFAHHPHELTHVVALQLGHPTKAVDEGFAVFMSGEWQGMTPRAYGNWISDEGRLLSISKLLDPMAFVDADARAPDAYGEAGALVAWVFDVAGRAGVRNLYVRAADTNTPQANLQVLSDILNVNESRVDADFRTWLGAP